MQIYDFSEHIITLSGDNSYAGLRSEIKYSPLGIRFVCDASGRLIGILTESDLKYSKIDMQNAMNTNFKYVKQENCNEEAQSIFKDYPSIGVLPVLDNERKIVSLITKNDVRQVTDWALPFSYEDIYSIFEKYNLLDSWHYRCWNLDWGRTLDSRRFVLDFIMDNIPKDAKILDVACGTGHMCFYLANQGFNNLHGFDYSEELISIGKSFLSLKPSYDKFEKSISFTIDNAFSPSFDVKDFSVAIFLGWVGCAAGFNAAFDDNTPIHEIVDSLFKTYTFSEGSYVILDVYDDLSNFEISKTKPAYRTVKYEDLKPVFTKNGYEIVDKCYDCDYKVKVIYVLKKISKAREFNE